MSERGIFLYWDIADPFFIANRVWIRTEKRVCFVLFAFWILWQLQNAFFLKLGYGLFHDLSGQSHRLETALFFGMMKHFAFGTLRIADMIFKVSNEGCLTGAQRFAKMRLVFNEKAGKRGVAGAQRAAYVAGIQTGTKAGHENGCLLSGQTKLVNFIAVQNQRFGTVGVFAKINTANGFFKGGMTYLLRRTQTQMRLFLSFFTSRFFISISNVIKLISNGDLQSH